jgi:hypothetical protein
MECHAVIAQGFCHYLHQAYVTTDLTTNVSASDQFDTESVNTGCLAVSLEQTKHTATANNIN